MSTTELDFTPDVYDVECALLARVRQLLNDSALSHLEIYRRTGLKPAWLRMVATGETAAPSVNRIMYLHEFLTGKKLVIH